MRPRRLDDDDVARLSYQGIEVAAVPPPPFVPKKRKRRHMQAGPYRHEWGDEKPKQKKPKGKKKTLLQRLFPKSGGAKCVWCKRMIGIEDASVEHMKPRSKGGTNDWSNLAIACQRCNWTRGDHEGTPEEAERLRLERRK